MMRGWVEVVPRWGGSAEWAILDWSEYFDSGALIGTFRRRSKAHAAAEVHARQHGRKLCTAEIITFPRIQEGKA